MALAQHHLPPQVHRLVTGQRPTVVADQAVGHREVAQGDERTAMVLPEVLKPRGVRGRVPVEGRSVAAQPAQVCGQSTGRHQGVRMILAEMANCPAWTDSVERPGVFEVALVAQNVGEREPQMQQLPDQRRRGAPLLEQG